MRRLSPPSTRRLSLSLLFFLLLSGGISFRAPFPYLPEVVAASSRQKDFTGKVAGVSDGDTMTVLVNGQGRKVRLYGVDTPEKKQPYGAKAKQFTSSLVFGKDVSVTVVSKDRYGRYVGIVRLPDGRCLNHELVKHGYAWWYSHYAPDDMELKNLERQARAEKRQLWVEPTAIPPWIFRKRARDQAVANR